MPYSSEHKVRTRARIVESARKLFNRHGFEQVSIDRIMTEAGLTRGGFYHHFDSKDELYAAAVASFSNCNPFKPDPVGHEPQQLARMLIDVYLSDEVLDNIDFHCPLYALPGDVARAGLSPQKAYTQLIRNLTQVYARALTGKPDGEQRAQAIVSLCVGGMVLARTTDDPALRRSLRTAARQQALALLDSG
ncbi:TetR/AcrR family transcriptional regulator [Herbaspirillum sp. ST 5-3]|uniref:TetR/AcrR family transcriptional regulator n=1 Tax=Oxalobacteraceae TaxID=75682 RepID=UPI0010A33E00|nr:TetR/AcrR family transcriptional regulator [Herbaspirillum sp. ST 5-3]